MALVVIAIGITAQILARRYGIERFARARDAEDELQRHYRAITEGAKELRINRIRRSLHAGRLVEEIPPSAPPVRAPIAM